MTLNPLELSRLTFDAELDPDGDLGYGIECDCYISSYLTREQMTALRDHLDRLLKASEPLPKKGEAGYVLTVDEPFVFDFERRWDARVKGNLS